MPRVLVLPLVASMAVLGPQASRAAVDPVAIKVKVEQARVKFVADRNAQVEVARVKSIEAGIEALRVRRDAFDQQARVLRTEIAGFIPFRYRNSDQIQYGLQKEAELLETENGARAVGEQMGVLRNQLPTGLAYREVVPNKERARREYEAVFWGLISEADASDLAGTADREQIIRGWLTDQGWARQPIEMFLFDLRAYIVANEIPPRKPRGGAAAVPPNPGPEPPRGQATLVEGRPYRLISKLQPERSIDVVNDGKNNLPVMARTANLSGQRWIFQSTGDGCYRIINGWQREKSLDVADDVGSDASPILIKTGNTTGQSWKVEHLGDGFYRIANKKQQQKCLTIIADPNGNSRPILAESAGSAGQIWKIAD